MNFQGTYYELWLKAVHILRSKRITDQHFQPTCSDGADPILCDVFQPLGFTEACTQIRQAGMENGSDFALPNCCASGKEQLSAWNERDRMDYDMVQPEVSGFTLIACRSIRPAHEHLQASSAGGPARAMNGNLANAMSQMQGTYHPPALVPWGSVNVPLASGLQQRQMQPQSYYEARSIEQDPS